MKYIARNQSHQDNQKHTFQVSFQKNSKEFSAALTSGSSCTIQDKEAQIVIEVEKGTRAAIMQHIHSITEAPGYATSHNECIVSPVVTIHTMEDSQQHLMSHPGTHVMHVQKDKNDNQPMNFESNKADESIDKPMKLDVSPPEEEGDQTVNHQTLENENSENKPSIRQQTLSPEEAGHYVEDQKIKLEPFSAPEDPEQPEYFVHKKMEEKSSYKFKLTIPDYVEQRDLVPSIQVKWGNIQVKLMDIRKGKCEDKFEPYCEVYNDHVAIYADHFCDVVCTCPKKVCTSKQLAFPFVQIYSEPGIKKTHMKVKTYLCNHLYQDKSVKKMSITVEHLALYFFLWASEFIGLYTPYIELKK